MGRGFAWTVGLLAGFATTAGADTLADVLRASGVTPPPGLADLDRQLGASVVSPDGGETVVVYDAGDARGPASLVALRVKPAASAFTRRPLAWPAAAPGGLDSDTCRRLDSARRHAGGLLVTAHVTPSAACTLVLGADLGLRAVLPGWPLATLPDGRIVYHRNQIHFASFHPLALDLFDPAGLTDLPLYPRKPYQAARLAHITRMRQVYTDPWCSARNHPCDPDVFDEHLASEVLVDPRGEALAFVVAFDNTTGWSDTERWGRLEPFRELRAALGPWNGQDPPPDGLGRALVAGLGRARNANAGPLVHAALSADPPLRDLVSAVLASSRPPGVDAARWLAALDPRWADALTWRRLARLIDVPDEFTEVVYVYRGLGLQARLRYREVPRREFEARFGRAGLSVALAPATLGELFPAGSD
jgi:hypothetical protein